MQWSRVCAMLCVVLSGCGKSEPPPTSAAGPNLKGFKPVVNGDLPNLAPATMAEGPAPLRTDAYYPTADGGVLRGADDLIMATVVSEGKVTGILLSNRTVTVGPNGKANADAVDASFSNALGLLYERGDGIHFSKEKLPDLTSDPIADYRAAAARDPKLTLLIYLQKTPLKEAANEVAGIAPPEKPIFYKLHNGSAVRSPDGLFVACTVAEGKVTGVYLSTIPPASFRDAGVPGDMDFGGDFAGKLVVVSDMGRHVDSRPLPLYLSDPVSTFSDAYRLDSSKTLTRFLEDSPLRSSVRSLAEE